MKDFEPLQNYVLLKAVETEKKTKAGLVMPSVDKAAVDVFVEEIGPTVKGTFKVGDCVIFNEYDAKWIGRENGARYVLVKDSSIMAIVPDPYRLDTPE